MSTHKIKPKPSPSAWKIAAEMLAVFFVADFCVLAILGIAYQFIRHFANS